MNHLFALEADRWYLPRHAHIVVYERERRGLLTIYDCSAAQKPPSAQLLGELVAVDADARIVPNPTGRVVTLREEATLDKIEPDRYRVARS